MYRRHTYREDIAGPAWLYRLYAGPRLVYVGVSSTPATRFVSHRRRPWWQRVDRVQFRWFATRAEAFAAERAAITGERPEQNVARPRGAAA